MSKSKNDGKQSIFADVKKLVRLLEESDLAVIEVAGSGQKIRLTKIGGGINQVTNGKGTKRNTPVSVTKKNSSNQLPSKIVEIKSTMVGYFYTAPAPNAEPFVNVGDLIHQGQILGIIEAMRLKTELKSDFAGRLLKILVNDTQPVEYDQPLFEIEIL